MGAFAEPSGESRFHLPQAKCHTDDQEKLDTTPQAPPLVIDDPSTPGCNRWEINVVMSEDYSKSEKDFQLPLLDINYGLGNDIQFKYEVPNSIYQSDEETRRGVGESNFGIKYKFFEDEEKDAQVAVYPQYQFVTPSSQGVEKGVAQSGSIIALPILYSTRVGTNRLGEIMMTANLGYNISTKADTADFVSSAIAVGMPVHPKISIMAELAADKSFIFNRFGIRDEIYRVDVGAFSAFIKHVLLFGSVGQSLYSSDGQNHTYILAGLRIQELSSLIFW